MPDISLTDYGSQLAELNRRQKLAQLLQEQSAEPIQIQSYKGIQAPIPWTAVLAKALQGGLAGYQSRKASQDQIGLAKGAKDEARQFVQGLSGIGAQPMPVQTAPTTPDLQLAPDRPQPQGAVSPPPVQMPPPQPGYADQPPAPGLNPAQQAQEMQSRALQASVSGNPYLEKLAPTIYDRGQKDEQRQRQIDAIDALPYDEHTKALLKNTMDGPKPVQDIIAASLKPDKPVGDIGQYQEAIKSGLIDPKQVSFSQFEEVLHPKPVTVMPGGNYMGDARNPGGAPAGAGGVSRGVRNNNPLNLTVPSSGPWAGQTGTDGRFAVFGSPQAGLAAADQNLQSYAKQGINTLQGIITKWAPPSENDTASYIQTVAKDTGLDPSKPLNMADPTVRQQILTSMSKVEIGSGSSAIKPLFTAPPKVSQSIWDQASPDMKKAISEAVGEKRYDGTRLNSRNVQAIGQILLDNPGINLMQNHGIAQMLSNPSFQNKALSLAVLPQVIDNTAEAGKKLNLSDVQFVGKVQAYLKGQLNDPDFENYMVQRIDAMQAIAAGMRQNGATDQSIKQEIEAAPITMSPRAWDAWAAGQKTAMSPRQQALGPITLDTHTGAFRVNPTQAPGAGGGGPKADYVFINGRLVKQ